MARRAKKDQAGESTKNAGTAKERVERLSAKHRELYEKMRQKANGEAGAADAEPGPGPAETGPEPEPGPSATGDASGSSAQSPFAAWEETVKQWQRQWQQATASASGEADPEGTWTPPWPGGANPWQAWTPPSGESNPWQAWMPPPGGANPWRAWTPPSGESNPWQAWVPPPGGPSSAGAGGPWEAWTAPPAGEPGSAAPNPWEQMMKQWQEWASAQGGAGAGTPPCDPWTASMPWQSWFAGAESGEPPGAAYSPKGTDPLVALKKSGSHPPLFLVAPIFGSVFPYHYLALHVEEEQPVYGLQSPAVDGGKPPDTIPAIAEHYVRIIRERQPRGPYYVGGYSFGGWAAFEIARQLLAAGKEVAFLGMLGTCAPLAMFAPLHAKAIEYSFELVDSQSRLNRDTGLSEQQRLAFEQAEAAAGTPQQRVAAASTLAALRYLPRPLEHGLSLFLTADVAWPTDHTLGWWLLCTREIDVCMHDGNHFNSFSEPHVQDLAKKLCARLRAARSEAGGS